MTIKESHLLGDLSQSRLGGPIFKVEAFRLERRQLWQRDWLLANDGVVNAGVGLRSVAHGVKDLSTCHASWEGMLEEVKSIGLV